MDSNSLGGSLSGSTRASNFRSPMQSLDEQDSTRIQLLPTSEPKFHIMHSYVLSFMNILLLFGYAAFIWLYPGWPMPLDWLSQEEPLFIMVCANGGVWLFATFTDRLLSSIHHVLRRRGYLDFYSRLEFLRRLPFFSFSATSVSLAIILVNCMRWIPESNDKFPSRLLVVQAFLSLQILLILPFYVVYTIVVIRFNMAKPPADVDGVPFGSSNSQQHAATSFGLGEQQTGNGSNSSGASLLNGLTVGFAEVGIRDESQCEQLLDRQADLITYYRQRNQHLLRKMARLTALAERNAISNDDINTGSSGSMVNA